MNPEHVVAWSPQPTYIVLTCVMGDDQRVPVMFLRSAPPLEILPGDYTALNFGDGRVVRVAEPPKEVVRLFGGIIASR